MYSGLLITLPTRDNHQHHLTCLQDSSAGTMALLSCRLGDGPIMGLSPHELDSVVSCRCHAANAGAMPYKHM